MTTLVSKHGEETFTFTHVKVANVLGGDLIIVSTAREVREAEKWVSVNGLSSVYFDQTSNERRYTGLKTIAVSDAAATVIQLHN